MSVTTLLLVAVLWPVVASAQIAVQVEPLRVELKTAAGQTYTQVVKIANRGTDPVRIHGHVDDYWLSKDGTPQYKAADGSMPYSAAAWVRLNPVEVAVAPGTEVAVRFSTITPADTPDGGYRAAVIWDLNPAGGDAIVSRGVAFRSRIATLVYATVGSPAAAVELADLQPRMVAGQAPSLVATLKNTGRVHVRTKGQVVVFDQAGTIVGRFAVPDVPSLPGTEREVTIALAGEGQPALNPGDYRVELRLDVGLPQVLVGETTISIKR